MTQHESEDNVRSTRQEHWLVGFIAGVSPIYLVSLIAAAAVLWSQVNDLKTTVAAIASDNKTLSSQFSQMNGESAAVNASITAQLSSIKGSLKDIKLQSQRDIDMVMSTRAKENEDTSRRLDSIERSIDRMLQKKE